MAQDLVAQIEEMKQDAYWRLQFEIAIKGDNERLRNENIQL